MPWYTDLKTVFEVFGGRELEYDWLLTELECNFLPPELQDGGAWFFSGSDLSDLVRRQDPPIQFIWAVLTGFDRGTSVDLAHLDMVPGADGNPDFWRGAPRIQYPNARVELVCFDSSLTLLITEDADLTSRFRAGFPEAVDLESSTGAEMMPADKPMQPASAAAALADDGQRRWTDLTAMPATTVLGLAFVCLACANVVHRVVKRRGPLMWTPAGKWMFLWWAWAVAVFCSAVASLADSIPPHVCPWIVVPGLAAIQVMSIVRRSRIASAAC
ncbi:MAG: hypothetical protein MUC36_17370 [Planctomycetes bacterium]|jgi:hypothetical protein|nr:hypothetical protein [Planctomycetota bacterium]